MMKPKVDIIMSHMIGKSIGNGAALAAAADVSPASARKVLRGESVTLATAIKITKALNNGQSVGTLFTSKTVETDAAIDDDGGES